MYALGVDMYALDADGDWREGDSTTVGEAGTFWSTRTTAMWGRTDPHARVDLEYLGHRYSVVASAIGWWLFLATSAPNIDSVSQCIGPRR